jgi:predicted  nucleic acid-binding Zn-ribbon protein
MFEKLTLTPVINEIICKLIKELETTNNNYNQLQTEIQDLKDKKQKLETEIKNCHDLIDSLEKTIDQKMEENEKIYEELNSVIKEMANKISNSDNSYSVTLSKLSERNKILEELRENSLFSQKMAAQEIKKLRDEIDNLKNNINSKEIDNSEINKELYKACSQGNVENVKLLLDKGVDVNAKDTEGWTVLMYASEYGHTEIVKLLLESGADVNAKTEYGNTALICASVNGYTEIVKMLLEAGADVNVKSECGYTALMYASEDGHKDMVKLLLENGAK